MITPEQSRAARAWLDWSQEDLAKAANVSMSTVRDFEKGRRVPIGNNLVAMQSALKAAGMQLTYDGGEPTGIRYEGRIKEKDIYRPLLEILDDAAEGFLKTSNIIQGLESMFNPRGADAEILANRSDSRFTQIVRNIVSHRETAGNPICEGWVEYDKARRGMTITTLGRRALVALQTDQHNGP